MRTITLIAVSLLMLSTARAQNLPDGPGKDVFMKVCSACHGLDLATDQKKTKDAWKETVDRMVGYGAEVTKEQQEAIVNYLAAHFGAAADAPKAAQVNAKAEPKTELNASMMPEGPGKAVILRECTTCHAPDHFVKYRHTNDEWQAIVTRMGQRVKSGIGKEDLDLVEKYLATNFPKTEEAGKVNVNKASVKDIADQLALTPAEATAVVQYRERHGNFGQWGELLVIYGVDGRKVEAAKDRMSF
jgi:competence ComEA-like helix-hairpin-helix protein